MTGDLVTYTPLSAGELEQSWELASKVAATEFVPVAMRGKPEAVLASILTGRELGIGPMQSLKHIGIVEGKPGLSAELMAGLVRARGHKLRIITRTTTEAEVEGVRADDPQHPLRVRWTLKDAERAGLCRIDEHGKPIARSQRGQPMPWEKYPDALLLARAISAVCRALFSDVTAGFGYTPEEIEGEQTEATWGEVEVDHTTGEVVAETTGRLDSASPPAQPAGARPLFAGVHANPDGSPTGYRIPTLDQIDTLTDVDHVKTMLQDQDTLPEYRMAVKAVVGGDWWPTFWRTAPIGDWQKVLVEALNPSAAGVGGTEAPAADHQSGVAPLGEAGATPDDPEGGDGP